ncbi:MAG: RNA-binding protein [Acidobacteria bacterium]|nr:RNA-binding protein [Acidobacteriota bacterium]
MGKRLFVGNLPYSATADDLRAMFAELGDVTDVHIVMDRETGRPRGFAFVSYATDEQAARAAQQMNGKNFGGRPLVVNEARERGSGPAPGERPPRPDGAGRPGGMRGPGGPRPGGFTRSPRPSPMPAPTEPPPEERRRTGPRKKSEPDRDRQPKVRPREGEEQGSRGGGWRQWIEDDEEGS